MACKKAENCNISDLFPKDRDHFNWSWSFVRSRSLLVISLNDLDQYHWSRSFKEITLTNRVRDAEGKQIIFATLWMMSNWSDILSPSATCKNICIKALTVCPYDCNSFKKSPHHLTSDLDLWSWSFKRSLLWSWSITKTI